MHDIRINLLGGISCLPSIAHINKLWDRRRCLRSRQICRYVPVSRYFTLWSLYIYMILKHTLLVKYPFLKAKDLGSKHCLTFFYPACMIAVGIFEKIAEILIITLSAPSFPQRLYRARCIAHLKNWQKFCKTFFSCVLSYSS